MKKIIDVATLSSEQRKFLLVIFATSDLYLRIFEELNPKWMLLLQKQTNAYLAEIFCYSEEEQSKALQDYLTID
jgi:hypothetical protein